MTVAFIIAYNGNENSPISGAEIASLFDFEYKERALEPTLQKLSNAGIISSIKGPRGGYFVNEPEHVTIADIADAIDDREIAGYGGHNPYKNIVSHRFNKIEDSLLDSMSVTTLKYLCNKASKNGVSTLDSPPTMDFVV